MIFITVGTHNQGFERLVKKIDEIALQFDEKIVIQIGHTKYLPKNMEWYIFLKPSEISSLYANSRIIITHAGAGSLLDALSTNNHVVVVPRLKKFKEHIDDQQLDLAKYMENNEKVTVVYDINNLEEAVKSSKSLNINVKNVSKNSKLINYLKETIKSFE